MASIGISHALHLNHCIRIDPSRSVHGFGLRGLVTADSVGTWPADCVIAFFLPPLDKRFATHRIVPPREIIEEREKVAYNFAWPAMTARS
jgi:hypothetical protein